MMIDGPGRQDGSGIRVVVQNGEYWLCNKGDLAMLDVTLRRLEERWPRARVGVLTSAPHLLRAFFPGAEPVSDRGAGDWPGTDVLGRLAEQAGPQVVGPASVGWLAARDLPRQHLLRARSATRHLQQLALPPSGGRGRADTGRAPGQAIGRRPVPRALGTASLVLAMGGGYFTDVDPGQAHRTLDMLEHALDRSIPAAMVGQGLGPVEDPALLARAASVLPRVDVLALREPLQGPALLARLGVPAERVVVTGDDAVALSYAVRQPTMGSDLGVCLRVAEYSPVAARTKDAVGAATRSFAREVSAGLVPLIISEFRSEDRRSTLPLVKGFPDVVPPLGRYVRPQELAARVSRCRVLVTGAYHLGVFALSQGIPVVGLSSSRYYDDKFLGLGAMFERGVHLVRLDEPDLDARLDRAIREAWAQAPRVREPLRARARAQIEMSERGFERIFELVERSRQRTGPG